MLVTVAVYLQENLLELQAQICTVLQWRPIIMSHDYRRLISTAQLSVTVNNFHCVLLSS